MDTKACSITDHEIKVLIEHHGIHLGRDDTADRVERINYLHKRLKAFREPEAKVEAKPEAPKPLSAAPAVAQGWGNANG